MNRRISRAFELVQPHYHKRAQNSRGNSPKDVLPISYIGSFIVGFQLVFNLDTRLPCAPGEHPIDDQSFLRCSPTHFVGHDPTRGRWWPKWFSAEPGSSGRGKESLQHLIKDAKVLISWAHVCQPKGTPGPVSSPALTMICL